MKHVLFPKGHIFKAPWDGAGYIATRDLIWGEPILPRDLEPFGDVPKPEIGARIPYWLAPQLR